MRYAELHCHSNFSFLDGASHPEDLVETATELGYGALAITDHHGFYGAVRFSTAAHAAGLPAVYGVEIGVETEDRRRKTEDDPIIKAESWDQRQLTSHVAPKGPSQTPARAETNQPAFYRSSRSSRRITSGLSGAVEIGHHRPDPGGEGSAHIPLVGFGGSCSDSRPSCPEWLPARSRSCRGPAR